MKKLLIIIDMQNDFISGVLGTDQARDVVPKVVKKIKEWNGDILVTLDEHSYDYSNTLEGKNICKHCMEGTAGCQLDAYVAEALCQKKDEPLMYHKSTFGDYYLPETIEADEIEIVGVCTDICVISNALILRSRFPNIEITVDSTCCAGTSPEMHEAALDIMKQCLINVK